MSKKFKIYLADLAHDYLTSNFTVPLGVGFVVEYLEALYPKKLEIFYLSLQRNCLRH